MDDADKKELAARIAEDLEDSVGIATEDDRDLTARVIVARIERTLYAMGWLPPSTYDRIHDWRTRTANLPEHHINRDVLTSHLVELSAILHDR